MFRCPQLARLLADHWRRSRFAKHSDWVFATANGTPYGHRNVTRRGLQRAARHAGIDNGTGPALRYHDLRHSFASHLILDLGLDVAQTSRILGHASPTITLNVYTTGSRRPATCERSVPAWRQARSPNCSTR